MMRTTGLAILLFLLTVGGCSKKTNSDSGDESSQRTASRESKSKTKTKDEAAKKEQGARGASDLAARQKGDESGTGQAAEDTKDKFPKVAPPRTRPGSKQVRFRLRWKSGKTYRFRSLNKQKIEQTVMGRVQNMRQTIGMGTTFRIQNVDAAKVATIDVMYHWIRFQQETTRGKISYDSKNPAAKLNPIAKVFAALHNRTFQLKMGPLGKVHDISGVQKMLKAALDAMQLSNPQARQMVKKQLVQRFSDKALKKTMESMFAVYPKKPVRVGATWKRKAKTAGAFPMQVYSVYTFVKLEGHLAHLMVTSRIQIREAQMGVGNARVSYKMSGRQSGTLKVNTQSGLPVKSEIAQTITGTVSMKRGSKGKMSWPIKIHSKVRVSQEKNAAKQARQTKS
jgi:hypothetical protein